jgi:hypothetical protein
MVKPFLEEIGIGELADEQLKEICEIGEKAAGDCEYLRELPCKSTR